MIAIAPARFHAQDSAPPRRESVAVRVFFEVRVDQKSLIEVLNEVARAKARLVLAGELTPEDFFREVEEQKRRYQVELTLDGVRTVAELFDQAGDLSRAVTLYRDALRWEPHHPDVLNNLGVALSKLGQQREAIRLLEEAIRVKNSEPKFYNNLAIAFDEDGQHEKAMERLEDAIRLDPQYAPAYVNRALVHRENRRFSRAVEDLLRALSLRDRLTREHPKSVIGHCFLILGADLMDLGRYAEALDAFDRGVENEGNVPLALLNKASVLEMLQRKDEAREALQAFERRPESQAMMKEEPVRKIVMELRSHLARSARLADLVDSVSIDVPEDVDFSDWDQLAAFLESAGD